MVSPVVEYSDALLLLDDANDCRKFRPDDASPGVSFEWGNLHCLPLLHVPFFQKIQVRRVELGLLPSFRGSDGTTVLASSGLGSSSLNAVDANGSL
jgi:hypothetical protein